MKKIEETDRTKRSKRIMKNYIEKSELKRRNSIMDTDRTVQNDSF